MIPPASNEKKWTFLAVALLPLTLIGISFREPIAQAARQNHTPENSTALPDGVYLYGNASQPNQLLHNYVVFEQQNGEVIGAFYSPQSDFTCFAGDIEGTQLEVKAVAPEQPPYDMRAQLSALNSISTLSSNDQHILSTCKQATVALARN